MGEKSSVKKPMVYIAGPYTAPDPAINTRQAILFGQGIRDSLDVVAIVPHFSHFEHLLAPKPYEYWLRIDLDLLARCDALYRLPGASTGADKEVEFAKAHGIHVFDTIRDLERWVCHSRAIAP